MENKKVTRYEGYIYSPGTAQGFNSMERLGIPRPVFKIERKLKNTINSLLEKTLKSILEDFKKAAEKSGLLKEKLTQDGLKDKNHLLEFLKEMTKSEEGAKETIENTQRKMQVSAIEQILKSEWEEEEIPDLEAEHRMADLLQLQQKIYLKTLKKIVNPKILTSIDNFSIDKKKLYENNMELLRKNYLDDCKERAEYECSLLRKWFLNALTDYAEGRSEKLELRGITNALYKKKDKMSQFFARDQLARFNKATTLATYENAGVTKVKWVTTHDVRVRESHKALDGKIFDIHNLPQELNDYNCRCGLVPVEFAD